MASMSALKKQKLDKNIKMLTRRNDEWIFVSRKRKIFEAMRTIGKQDRAFVLAVSNVLTKSMWMKGFINIREGSRDNHKDSSQYRHINMMILRFLKGNVGEYFTKWKNGARINVN